jgi:hypothetical protein
MSNKTIPKEVKAQVEQIVQTFNQEIIKAPNYFYTTYYRGLYLYLARMMGGPASPVCRLKYTGQMDDWEFAIYKYSNERYDPDEWFFPGSGEVDGTIVGAMKAGLEAYP